MKKQTILFWLIFFLLSSCATNSSMSSPKNFQHDKIAERITKAIGPQIGSKNVGAIVALYNKGKVEYLSFGESARGNKSPPDADTLFEIGSITKTFTGLMLARSIELERVKDSDALEQFKKEWRGQKTSAITLLDLANHKSGLPRIPCNMHYKDPRAPYEDYTEEDLIFGLTDRLTEAHSNSKCEIKTRPTPDMHYSNWGAATLGYVLADHQHKTYEALLDELITGPLGLNDTAIKLSLDQRGRLARGYDQSLHENPYWDQQVMYGAGAIRSSARDLIKYAIAYLHPDKTPFAKSIQRAKAYSWFMRPSGNIWHDGMTGGFSSFIKIYPKDDMAVLYLSNTARSIDCFVEAVEDVPCGKNE